MKQKQDKANVTGTASKPHPFKAVRRAGVPLVSWETPDPAATVTSVIKSLNGKADTTPVLIWDIIRGLTGCNPLGVTLANELSPNGAMSTGNPAECLTILASKLPEQIDPASGETDDSKRPFRAVVFFSNAQRFLSNESVLQCVWNLRDVLKGFGGTLVLLSPGMKLPPELSQDVVTITEALPEPPELGAIVDSICEDAGLKADKLEDKPRIVDTLLGLSAFAAEQTLALSITSAGVDMGGLWERKRKTIEQTPGLAVWNGGESFDDLGGLDNLKTFLKRVLSSEKNPVRALLYLDELEKSLGGSGGDTSGTSQDQLGVLLKIMQDENLPGLILVGPPGTGKSSIAKAAGTVANSPVIACDLGAMKGSLVGESEARIRAAMDVFKAVSQRKGLAIATCNKLAALPPELKRRFSLGCFYIDLPTPEEQAKIWPYWIARYKLDNTQPLPACDSWTGAEIRACCDVAWRATMTLREAASFVVPVCKSGQESIEALRKAAHGKFISANYAGTYDMNRQAKAATTGRRIEND